jgi:hypothetical protein
LQVLSAAGLPAKTPDWLQVDESWGSPSGITLVVLNSGDEFGANLVEKLAESATVLVFGPSAGSGWREAALEAGVFGCLSDATPLEDRNGLILAACRHHAARAEYKTLRKHHDRLCLELVTSFGEAMDKLSNVKDEVRSESSALEEIRLRILRALV